MGFFHGAAVVYYYLFVFFSGSGLSGPSPSSELVKDQVISKQTEGDTVVSSSSLESEGGPGVSAFSSVFLI